MSSKDRIVDAEGQIGIVYTTRTGLETADPSEEVWGWMQISATQRLRVESRLTVPAVPAKYSWLPYESV